MADRAAQGLGSGLVEGSTGTATRNWATCRPFVLMVT